jgi:sulfur carrier protein
VSTNETIQLLLNGETRHVPRGVTIQALLESLEIDPTTVAVELDRRIIKPKDWPAHALHEGAQLEIVQFVGGG